ncbi:MULTISPECIES: hypothetical protein [unclassified Shinella]|uniref:hypothetical protein n=1 Tax=unclassified Shinella TaxID=2643062 RepID=UPI000680ED56|nr:MULTISPECIES: hypothetical protein [unclassified Shinella]
MSDARFSIIPAWIVTDSRLKGRDLQVLCLLGRYTNRKHGWCRRSQVKMAEELSIARSTVQASIDRLVDIGGVERRAVVSESGRDSAHWYRVIYDREVSSDAFAAWDAADEEEFGPMDGAETGVTPCRYTGTPAGIPAPPADSEPAPPAGPGSAPINDSTLTTDALPRERARERGEGDEEENHKAVLRRFRAWWSSMPAYKLDTEADVWAEWLALSPDQRRACEQKTPAWLEAWRQSKRSTPKASKNYLKERLWERCGDADAVKYAGGAAPAAEPSNPLSKAWMGLVFWTLLGPEKLVPQAKGMLASIMARDDEVGRRERIQYRQRHAWPDLAGPEGLFERPRRIVVSADVTAFSERFHSYRLLPDPEPEVAVWCAVFEQMGWPWPRTGGAGWLCLPRLDSPDEDAAWRVIDGLREKMRGMRGDEHAA